MNFTAKDIEQYCVAHSTLPISLLRDLERETHLKTLAPQMISGPVIGQFLHLMTLIKKPKHILEIGTFTGYATLCMASALTGESKITTLEANEELTFISGKYFEKSGLSHRIHALKGDANEILPTLPSPLDMVFIDAAKQDYVRYYEMVIEKVPSGGIILADNVLWSGKVIQNDKDAETAAIDAFNKKVLSDNRVDQVMLPIRDGISLLRKK